MRMQPTNESFHTADCARRKANLRLVVQHKLVILQRVSQAAFERDWRLTARRFISF